MNFDNKLHRISEGGSPRVLDLFAGCGGISLGFHGAGFEIVGAVEFDKHAAKSHALNFHKHCSAETHEIHAQARDITTTNPSDLLAEYGLKGATDSLIDVVVGGPPCQAFARVGRAKLREVAEHPDAFLQDPRGNLYLRYLDYVKELKPLAVLMENVPDVLNYGGHNVAEETCELLESWGYKARYTMLNAVYYGVPEMRERMFLIAYVDGIEPDDWFPKPTHWIDLPRGYHGSRQVALKTIKRDLFDTDAYYLDPPKPSTDLPPAVTAEQALSDLPVIPDDSEQKLSKGPRRFDKLQRYSSRAPLNIFQHLMRTWPSFESSDGIYDHVIRFLPRDYKIFARMMPGDQYPEAYDLAERMFSERLQHLEAKENKTLKPGSKEYDEERAKYVPPYDPSKFPNKWRKMEPNKPARTLMAHLGKDSYSHIHYDSLQARTISVREAARLQSFPDGFIYQGPMNPAFKQIGNAVPPLLSKALAEHMKKQLTGYNYATENCTQKAVSL